MVIMSSVSNLETLFSLVTVNKFILGISSPLNLPHAKQIVRQWTWWATYFSEWSCELAAKIMRFDASGLLPVASKSISIKILKIWCKSSVLFYFEKNSYKSPFTFCPNDPINLSFKSTFSGIHCRYKKALALNTTLELGVLSFKISVPFPQQRLLSSSCNSPR